MLCFDYQIENAYRDRNRNRALNYIIYYFKLMRRKEYSISIKQIEMCVEYKASL